MKTPAIAIPEEVIRAFCEKHRIRKLALFGSVLRDDFTPESDIDMLVELDPEARIGLIRFCGMQNELSDLIGRRVDLTSFDELSPYIRDEVLAEAESIYDAAQ